jgi:hypothetical protein
MLPSNPPFLDDATYMVFSRKRHEKCLELTRKTSQERTLKKLILKFHYFAN